MPKGPLRVRAPRKFPEGESRAEEERPGANCFIISSLEAVINPRVKVRTPTLANVPSIIEKLKGETVAEIPIVVASVDSRFNCTERMTIIDSETGDSRVMNQKELRRLKTVTPLSFIFSCIVFPGVLFSTLLALFYEGVDRKIAAHLQDRIGPPVWQPF